MAIKNYLIEGVSGTGKSSVCDELIKMGYPAINGDIELAYSGNPETGEKVNIHSHQTHIWDVEKVKTFTSDKNKAVMFFCGGSRNFSKFIDLFDKVFVLTADDETIIQRLRERRGDTFGKKPEEIELVLRLNNTKEDIPRDGIVIDATQPISAVANEIISHINSNYS